MNRPRCIALALLFWLAMGSLVWAQGERYELGRRLRVFEQTWDGQPDATARKRSTPALQKAVSSFFSFRLGEAGRALDEARHALISAEPRSKEQEWSDSLFVQLENNLTDASTPSVPVKVAMFYGPDLPPPAQAAVRLSLVSARGDAETAAAEMPVQRLPLETKLDLKGVPPGDHRLRCEVMVNGKTLATSTNWLATVERLQERLAAIERSLEGIPQTMRSLESETARSQLRLLQGLARGNPVETEYPAARLVGELEALTAASKKGEPYFTSRRTGQDWLTLPLERGSAVVRVQIPRTLKEGQRAPLVVALHGAGGSENLFFDGYGNGAVARLCEQRGWILVAPRSAGLGGAPVAAIVDELAKRYPVDPRSVFLVGHSMGAAQAMSAVAASPSKYAGVAALGGGGRVGKSEGIKAVPYFVGVGTEDFALRGARALRDALKAAEVRTVEYREYPDIEHLVIVQAALPEVFQFFDKQINR